jgi:hypothetical protein
LTQLQRRLLLCLQIPTTHCPPLPFMLTIPMSAQRSKVELMPALLEWSGGGFTAVLNFQHDVSLHRNCRRRSRWCEKPTCTAKLRFVPSTVSLLQHLSTWRHQLLLCTIITQLARSSLIGTRSRGCGQFHACPSCHLVGGCTKSASKHIYTELYMYI